MSRKFDVVVIGAGPAGYIAAIRAAQHGMTVACIDKWQNRDGKYAFGGTCLNAGCIPSKAMLHASELLHEAQHNFDKLGIVAKSVGVDLEKMHAHKASVIQANTQGIEFLFKKNKVDYIKGAASLIGPGAISVTDEAGNEAELAAANVVLATGSEHMDLPGIQIDEKRIVSSTGALSLAKVPKRLIVVGADEPVRANETARLILQAANDIHVLGAGDTDPDGIVLTEDARIASDHDNLTLSVDLQANNNEDVGGQREDDDQKGIGSVRINADIDRRVQ